MRFACHVVCIFPAAPGIMATAGSRMAERCRAFAFGIQPLQSGLPTGAGWCRPGARRFLALDHFGALSFSRTACRTSVPENCKMTEASG